MTSPPAECKASGRHRYHEFVIEPSSNWPATDHAPGRFRVTCRKCSVRAIIKHAVKLPACTDETPCCDRRNEYNGYGSGPSLFICPRSGGCACHD